MKPRRIIIETIDPDKMRYDTVGDWFIDDSGDLRIQVASQEILPNVDADALSTETFLIALHELVEVKLCLNDGIDQEMVDKFDFSFNKKGEPGDDPEAPYRKQHRRAMIIEHLMADWLGVAGYGKVE